MDSIKKDTLFNFFLNFSLTLVSAILAIYFKDIGFSYEEIGFLMSLFPLAIILLLPIIGNLSDSLGKKNVLAMGLIFEIVAIFLYVFGKYIALARILEGISAMSLTIITIAMAEDDIKSKRGEKTGFLLSLGHVGKIIAAPFAFFMANIFIKTPFYISLGILFFLLISIMKRDSKRRKAKWEYFESLKRFLSYKKLRGMAIVGIAKHASTPLITAFIPLMLADRFGMDKAGIALFLLELPNVLQWFFGKVSDRKTPAPLVIGGLIVFSLSIMAMIFVNSFVAISILLVIAGIGNSMWNVSAWDLMSNIGEKIHKEGSIITSYISIAKTGSFASFIISGIIAGGYGMNALIAFNGFLIIIASIIAAPMIQ